MGMLALAKIAQVSLEYLSYLPSAGALVVFTSMFWRRLSLFNDVPCFDGQWRKDFSLLLNQHSFYFSCRLIFDPFIPLGIITLQCWSYLGLPNTNVVCVQECFLNVFNTT